MGAEPSKPFTADKAVLRTSLVTFDTMCAGWAEMQGYRDTMEDAHCTVDLGGGNYFFAVFDGHGGDKSSNCASKVLPYLMQQIMNDFVSIDVAIRRIKLAVAAMDRLLALIFDLELAANHKTVIDGCTATCALVTPSTIFLINLGDSRSVVINPDGSFVQTNDHKPTNPEEERRIVEAGGIVSSGRVDGDLAVSRALGDFEFKRNVEKSSFHQRVSHEVDVFPVARQAN